MIVRDGLYAKRFEPNVDVFDLASAAAPALPAPAAGDGGVPVRFDIKIQAPRHAAGREQPGAASWRAPT